MNENGPQEDTPLDLPIDGVLDLHTFRPSELGELVPAYLTECRARGILQVRVIHGKGIGNVKRSVEAILARLPEVVSFTEASALFGGSGATIVNLRPGKNS
ncbi:MAG TPA: Smr/MutS family protein [Candidatus Acidoferrum sp.]|nr:Smr/MutS family protein [Candidatus Acidoferrum sp.]